MSLFYGWFWRGVLCSRDEAEAISLSQDAFGQPGTGFWCPSTRMLHFLLRFFIFLDSGSGKMLVFNKLMKEEHLIIHNLYKKYQLKAWRKTSNILQVQKCSCWTLLENYSKKMCMLFSAVSFNNHFGCIIFSPNIYIYYTYLGSTLYVTTKNIWLLF
jgi:hypothetical protein